MAWRSNTLSLPWKVPSIIILSFFAAVFIAFAHHVFYQSLDGTLVREAMFDQQYNVAIGTAFAFLVRALLVLSIGTTYWQVFWRTLRSETLTVANINTLFSLLHNAFAFVKVGALFRHPLLVAIAILSWTIPIAIIVPPATLSIKSQTVTSHEFRAMDIPYFNTSTMAQVRGSAGDKPLIHQFYNSSAPIFQSCDYKGQFILYNGPSERLSRMTMATAYQGALPTLPDPPVNASYTLSFNAPATRCEAAPRSVLSQLGVFDIDDGEGKPDHFYIPNYLSWTPTSSSLVPPNLIGTAQMYTQPITFNPISGASSNGTYGFSSYVGQYKNSPPSLFVAWASNNESYVVKKALNCSFYNATYIADFEFTNGQQKINISSVTLLNNPLKLSVPIWDNCKNGAKIGTILTGEQVGYQAMIETLGRALVGTVAFSEGVLQSTDPTVVDQTSVMKTNLAYSNELARLYAVSEMIGIPSNENPSLLEVAVNTSSVPRTGLSLAASIEQLFHNMTMSLFSDSSMLIQSPSTTRMTVTKAQNVYSYSWEKLVLAYGVACFVTFLTVVLGCIMLVANGAAYSSDFSTFMRLVRGQHIDDVVLAYDDRDGADPLPEKLAKAEIHIDSAGTGVQNLSEDNGTRRSGNAVERHGRKDIVKNTSSSTARLLVRSSWGS